MNICRTENEELILNIISKDLYHMGYDIVRIRIRGGSKRKNLQIMLERLDQASITLSDCQKASDHVSALLDVEDPIESEYILEMSSPGIDRPLTRFKDYQSSIGCKISITTKLSLSGRKKFIGVLKSLEEKAILLQEVFMNKSFKSKKSVDDNDSLIEIQFDNIMEANLIFEMKNHKAEQGNKK